MCLLQKGQTVLMWAAALGDIMNIALLLENELDIDAKDKVMKSI